MRENKTIRWKVVRKDNRRSISISSLRKLGRTYTKGKVISAHPESLGLFCFKRKCQAEAFMLHYFILDGEIIKVKTYGKGKTPSFLFDFWDVNRVTSKIIIDWYKKRNMFTRDEIPMGTICYPAVMPLE
jgi:hypothetical protein